VLRYEENILKEAEKEVKKEIRNFDEGNFFLFMKEKEIFKGFH
jgi:hypothetical protein